MCCVPSDEESYVAGILGLTASHGVRVIATGDMDLVGTMKRNWIEECGEDAEVAAYLPLWQTDREANINTLVASGFRVVFSCVKTPYFDASWIGRQLDPTALAEMKAMAVVGDGPPLDLGGRAGHSMPSQLYNVSCAVPEPLTSSPLSCLKVALS